MTRLFVKQLLIAILPVLLLAALSTLWIASISERNLLSLLQDEIKSESELHAAGVKAYIDERVTELRTMAATPVIRSQNREAVVQYLAAERARMQRYLEGLYHTDLEGGVTSDGGKQFSIRDRSYFPRLQQGATIVTRLESSRDTQHEILLILVPIYNADNKHIGALGSAVPISTLVQRVERILPPETGFAALIDDDHTILTKQTPSTPEQREDLTRWLQHASDGNTEVVLGETDFVTYLRSVPNTKFKFVLAKKRSLVTERVVAMRRMNLLISCAALLVAFGIAFVSTRQLLKPLGELLAICKRLGTGDLKARATNLPHDEIGELGAAFNRAADQLAEREAAAQAATIELRASEGRFRALVDGIGEAIFVHDRSGSILDVNSVACARLGYARDELLRLSVQDINPDVSLELIQDIWQGLHQGVSSYRREGRHRRKDGTEFPVEVNLVPLHESGGMRVLASVRDISERKQGEEKMAKFFRLSEDMMCIADTQGNFVKLSPAFEQVLGWPLEELVGQPYLLFVHPDDREHTLAEAERVINGEGAVNFENRYRCQDGSYRWLQWRPFKEVDEGIIYAIARDVTDSHRLVRLMAETSAAAHIGGWELDFITGELFWTPETYYLHDTSPEEYTPSIDTAIGFYAPASQPLIRAAIEKAQVDGSAWSLELELITAKGRPIWAHALGRVEIDNGRAMRAFGSFQDITARRQGEDERREIDAQLREMQRVESIGILAGGIAHDFNNLLTGILGFTRLAISESQTTPIVLSHLQQIEQCSMRAADLCKQLLAYAGKGKFVIETISLSELVRDTATLVESILDSHAKLILELDPQVPLIEGDATQIRQVVMNLTTNAYDALNGKAGEVRVQTGLREIDEAWLQAAIVRGDVSPGKMVFVEVSDTGCGMDAETLARIFDPFFTTKFAGRGLGLAAALGIVRSHHGAIRVISAPGQGSTFAVVFPPCEEVANDPPTATPGLPTTAAVNGDVDALFAGGQLGDVLIVDDEASVRSLAATALERGGYRCWLAENGPQGLELYQTHRATIVAVLIDMTMPGMTGLEVAKVIHTQAKRLPLLLMSGYTDVKLDSKADSPVHSDFVQKPFKLGDLLNAVHSAVQGTMPTDAKSKEGT